jgi:hypothetical protein
MVHGLTHTVDDVRPALRDRCPIDVAVLTRWFLECDGEADGSAAPNPPEQIAAESPAWGMQTMQGAGAVAAKVDALDGV